MVLQNVTTTKNTSHSHRLRFIVFLTFVFVALTSYAQPSINLDTHRSLTAGQYVNYFQETDERLSLEQAMQIFDSRPENLGHSQSISLGISVAPVWLKVRLEKNQNPDTLYRFSTETPWLDHIDAWLVHQNQVLEQVYGGDALPYLERPLQYRYFAFESTLPTGTTELYLRVESVGPMAIPLHIAESSLAIERDIANSYHYGFLYGIMVALAIYNLIIFFSIGHKEHGLYAIYLLGFVLNSLSYTGQLHTWFTPDWGPYFQDWLDISLMITYSIAGLHFARLLLNTKDYAPRLDKLSVAITLIIPMGMVIGAIINSLTLSLLLAFLLNTSFALLFIAMGVQALKHHVAAAKLFLVCSVTAATCICISTAAVAGLLPYNDFTFKLIEIGMALEAMFLAFLLAQRFRAAETEKREAQKSARLDALTHLNNRRGFEHAVHPMWHQHLRSKNDVSVIMLDIDHFKKINDTYGHMQGDEVLRSIAALLEYGSRRSDIVARWGGEEFLLFLPDTNQEQALQQAERLRLLIANANIDSDTGNIAVTASFGVCGTLDGKFEGGDMQDNLLEYIIHSADKALYQVKNSGRNQVLAHT